MKYVAMALSVALALTVGGVALAGRVPTPGFDVARAQARSTVTYHETFRGGEVAVVSIVGDGDTDLDLFVYDEFNNLVAFANGLSDRETVSFTPRWTGRFRIEVRNLGGVWNEFTLRTN
jgi:hypothetical protein